jgi:hypothetical protein
MSSYRGSPPAGNPPSPSAGNYPPGTSHSSTGAAYPAPDSTHQSFRHASPSTTMNYPPYGPSSPLATYEQGSNQYPPGMGYHSQVNDPRAPRNPTDVSLAETAYQNPHILPIQPIISQSTSYIHSASQFNQSVVSDPEKAANVTVSDPFKITVHLTEDPVKYFRQHRITAPWLDWVDALEPDTRRRWWKLPKRVKFGTKTNSDHDQRQKYALQKVFSYHKDKGQGYRMKDAFDRVHRRPKDERYISSYDGALKELVVQCTDELFYQKNDAPWMRTRINDLAPYALRVADWCAWTIKRPGMSDERRILRRVIGPFLLFLPVSLNILLVLLNLVDPIRFHGAIHR